MSTTKQEHRNDVRVTFPPTRIPSTIVYIAGGGLGAAWAENNPFGLSTNSRFLSFPGGAPTLNSYGFNRTKHARISTTK